MKKIILGLVALSSLLSFASPPQQLSCNYNSSEGFKTFKFNLSDYTNEYGVKLNEEIRVGSKTISISVISSSGTIEIALLEPRGIYTAEDICASGRCQVGTPKMGALLKSLTNWQVGKNAMINSYASPKKGEYYRVDCYVEGI